VSTAHNHSFGFGEEACEICGMPFIDAQDDSSACPGANPNSAIAYAAAPINRPQYNTPRLSLIGLFAHAIRRFTY
jgi:hypothetical protein